MFNKKNVPSWWLEKPLWFKNNDWMIQNQDHDFVKRMGNVIHAIECDLAIKQPGDKPMQATRQCYMGEISVDGNKFQYKEMLNQLKTLEGNDRLSADEVIKNFNNDYKDYLFSLKTPNFDKLKKSIGKNVFVVYVKDGHLKGSDYGKLHSVGDSIIIITSFGHTEIPLFNGDCKVSKVYNSKGAVIYNKNK